VLVELRVENLLLIERAELALDPGLNVITGETGAGKTVLAHALDLLLGGRPRAGIVRPGADEAYVEGVFEPAGPLAADPELADLAERVPLDGDELVLARRVTAGGRTRAYVQGRSASAADLRALGTRLLAFYGQHEHRKLTLSSAQLEVLDAFCGDEHVERRDRYEQLWARTRSAHRELEQLRERAGERERDLDLLEFELREITEAEPDEREEAELEADRARLQSVDVLRQATALAEAALDQESDSGAAAGALAALSGAEAVLARAQGSDPRLDGLAERIRALSYEAQEVARELRDYGSGLEADPERLHHVEERLELLARLKRKHGGSIVAVLEHAERCRTEHERLSNAGDTSAMLERELAQSLTELEREAGQLRSTRTRAARKLERAMKEELAELAMAGAGFEVALEQRELDDARGPLAPYGPRGADAAEFLIATNPGVEAGRLREIASGGELSRVMLALLTVAANAGGPRTIVFDEIDSGVGGNTARAVGNKLRLLAQRRQVICITHLPQVASLASRHFRVVKSTGASVPARAEVEALASGELVGELCRMLGADAGDGAARKHAEQLLQAA
jgi:DNA repair protein RecN (Recombination protein N)